MNTPDDVDTVPLVPLSELLDLARLVAAMRKAQAAYFAAKKLMPHSTNTTEWRAARDLEKRVDGAVTDALARERRKLPGFE